VPKSPDNDNPAPLVVGAALAGIEGLVLVGYAVMEMFNVSSTRVTMGVTTSIFFLVYGAGLVGCAWAVTHGSSWARSPIVLAQFIQLGLTVSFWGHGTTPLAIGLGISALIVLVGVLHPASIDALVQDD
jgi:hypothetical protein